MLPALLYSAETYTLYRIHIKKLMQVQQRHLRKILNIKWQDMVTNAHVLKRADVSSVESMLTAAQLRWAGHVVRMNPERLPRKVLFGELVEGRRSGGGQKLRYKDVIKRHLKATNIDHSTWQTIAVNRSLWRNTVRNGVDVLERRRAADEERRHNERHNPDLRTVHCDLCPRSFCSGAGLTIHKRLKHR